jgi:hypothetical protein
VTSEFTFLLLVCQSVSVCSILHDTTSRKMIIDCHSDVYILSQIWLSNVVLSSVVLMFINEFASFRRSAIFVVQQYGETNSDLSVVAEEAKIDMMYLYRWPFPPY